MFRHPGVRSTRNIINEMSEFVLRLRLEKCHEHRRSTNPQLAMARSEKRLHCRSSPRLGQSITSTVYNPVRSTPYSPGIGQVSLAFIADGKESILRSKQRSLVYPCILVASTRVRRTRISNLWPVWIPHRILALHREDGRTQKFCRWSCRDALLVRLSRPLRRAEAWEH